MVVHDKNHCNVLPSIQYVVTVKLQHPVGKIHIQDSNPYLHMCVNTCNVLLIAGCMLVT